MSRTVIVVPCFNEARRLDLRALETYAARADAAELLFVNDGSRDETLDILRRLHADHPRRIRYLDLDRNGGKAEAVRQGILQAIASRPDYVGFWDADLATPLDDIAGFARVLDAEPRVEIVIGTRLPLLGHRIDRQPLRYWLGRLFANVASLALSVRIFDTQCGAKLFRVTDETAALFAQPFRTRWIFDVEIFARLAHARRRTERPQLRELLYEYPLDRWRDVAGSSVKRGDFVKAAGELASIYWAYLRPGAVGPHGAPPPTPIKPPTVAPPAVVPSAAPSQRSDQKAA
ncbi:MAG: glycosyltransferase [Pirellulales bacterium]